MKKLITLISLALLAVSSAAEIITWDANPASDNVTGYVVYYSATGTAPKPWSVLAKVPSSQLSATNAMAGRWYYYVTATNACCESDPSEVAFRPGNPQNLKIVK